VRFASVVVAVKSQALLAAPGLVSIPFTFQPLMARTCFYSKGLSVVLKPMITPTKLKLSIVIKICDIIIPVSLVSGADFCYLSITISNA